MKAWLVRLGEQVALWWGVATIAIVFTGAAVFLGLRAVLWLMGH